MKALVFAAGFGEDQGLHAVAPAAVATFRPINACSGASSGYRGSTASR